MAKVNMREVHNAASQLRAQGSQVQTQLSHVGSAMARVPRSDNFAGAAQRSMSGYVSHVHTDATHTLDDNISALISEMNHLIEAFKSGVDSNDSAIIDTSYLSQQKSKLSQLKTELEKGISQGNSGCSEASGLASVTRLRNTAVEKIETASHKIATTSQKITAFNGMQASSKMKSISESSSRVGSNIRLSGGSKSSRVFMEKLGYVGAKSNGTKAKQKRTSLKNLKHGQQHHKAKSSKLAKFFEMIHKGREWGDKGIAVTKTGWETIAAVKKSFKHTGYHKAVSLRYNKKGYKTFRQVRGDIKQTKNYKFIDKMDDWWGGSALGSKLSKHLADKEFEFAGGKVVAKVPIIGSLIDGGLTYGERQKKYGKKSALIDGTAHAGITAGATAIGAAIGTAIPIPGLGTIAGAAVGASIGNGLSKLYDSKVHKKTMKLQGSNAGWKFVKAINPLG